MTASIHPPRNSDLGKTLVEEGLRLGRRGGVAALGLREITRSVGVSANAAYRYFAHHDALLVAVAVEARALLAHHIIDRMNRETTQADAAARSVQRVSAFGLGYIEFALCEPGWLDLACHSQHAPHDAVPVLASSDLPPPPPPPHLLLVAALDDMLTCGALTQTQRVDAEWIIWSAVEGFTELTTNGPLQHADRTHLDQLARRIVDTTVQALMYSTQPVLG